MPQSCEGKTPAKKYFAVKKLRFNACYTVLLLEVLQWEYFCGEIGVNKLVFLKRSGLACKRQNITMKLLDVHFPAGK